MSTITPPQKATIRTLLDKAGYGTYRITRAHANRIPHVEADDIDRGVDHWIGRLTRDQAGDVIDFLLDQAE